jgi:hypothetical protein
MERDAAPDPDSPPPANAREEDLLPPDTQVLSSFVPQRRKKTKDLVFRLGGQVRKNPITIVVAAVLIYAIVGWVGYTYHVVKNRFFGTFVPHEKVLCRDEGMMLYVQRIMWARAKGEIANIIPDDSMNNFYSISRKHANDEILNLHNPNPIQVGMTSSGDENKNTKKRKKTKKQEEDDIYTAVKNEKTREDWESLQKRKHKMRSQHADNFSPSIPKNNFMKKKERVHRQRSKAIREAESSGDDDEVAIQHHLNYIDVRSITRDPLDYLDVASSSGGGGGGGGSEAGTTNEIDPLNPYAKIRITTDMGFYQHSFGTVDVTTVSRTNILGQNIGTYNSGNGFSTVVYYRIWKCANDYIRGLMYQYAQKKKVMDGETPICVNLKDCQESGFSSNTPGDRLRAVFFPAALRRYPFTFVRDPIQRFISGYTEIEYRYYKAAEHTESLGMPASMTPGMVRGGGVAVETDRTGAPVMIDPREKGDKEGNKRIEWSVSANGQRVKKVRTGVSAAIKTDGERTKGTKRERDRRRQPGTTGVSAHVKSDSEARLQAGGTRKADGSGKTHADLMGVPNPTAEDPEVKQTQILKVMPLRNPVGSVLRFTEFIDLILHFDGSRRLFKTYDNNMEMAHIAPQIGTLMAAAEAEALPIRLFHLETFTSEWKRLSQETGQDRLLEIRDAVKNHTKLWQHPSSDDEHRTKSAAGELMSVSLAVSAESVTADIRSGRLDKEEDAAAMYEVFAAEKEQQELQREAGGSGLRWQQQQQQEVQQKMPKGARRTPEETDALVHRAQTGMPHELLRLPMYRTMEIGYTRALCRLYVSDYVCAGYDLPYVCHDLHSEVEALEAAWESLEDRRYRKHGGGLSIMHSILPHWLLYMIAEIPCSLLSTSPPTCIAMFVHGDHIYDDDDELENGHEEL